MQRQKRSWAFWFRVGRDPRALELIEELELEPHPEGGWYRETWRDGSEPRARGTAIYFLLEADQASHWHKVDATEIWHHYAGGPLALDVYQDGTTWQEILSGEIEGDVRPQVVIPAHAWQRATPKEGWVLVGCTVSPGFEFSGFELAPKGWAPTASS